jgi:hypothetical protein
VLAARDAADDGWTGEPDDVVLAGADSELGTRTNHPTSELFSGFGEKVGAVPDDAILANSTIHWVTGTAASSIRH